MVLRSSVEELARPLSPSLDLDLESLETLRRASKRAWLDLTKDHLDEFLAARPDARYEEWIADLHPENARAARHAAKAVDGGPQDEMDPSEEDEEAAAEKEEEEEEERASAVQRGKGYGVWFHACVCVAGFGGVGLLVAT